MELTPEQAVKNGAEWLDKVYPEWWNRVDVGALEMDSCITCICGQTFGYGSEVTITQHFVTQDWQAHYSLSHIYCWMGYYAITDLADLAGLDSGQWSYDHGFSGYDRVYNPLWVAEIKRRADIGLVD